MTFKTIILLKRNEDMTLQQFRDWWLEDHAALAKQLPGLRQATFNLVRENGDGEFDGVSELWFDSRGHFEAAYDSDIGQQVAADSMSHVSRRERLLVSEHVVLPMA